MLIYTGKLQWQGYGEDELFIICLPTGHVRVGDIVYTFSQWTVDAKGVKKPNWFQKHAVVTVSKSDDGEDTFHLASGYYSFDIRTQQQYQSLAVTMSNPGGYKSTMELKRVYQSTGEETTEPIRTWTGKLDWPNYASNELMMVTVPEGFGPDKPVMVFWQWTTNAENQKKFPCVVNGVQKLETGSDRSLKFSFTDYYTMTCVWDEKTEKLSIHMQEPEKHGQDIGPFSLAAIFTPHTQ